MNQKAAEMNLSIKQKPTCGFCKKKGHNTQQCHQKLEAEYYIMNAIKPKPKEQVVSMTSDETTAQDTDIAMDTEASGKPLPNPIEEDSLATIDTRSDWTCLPRHDQQQKKEESPLSDISESAFKG